jgi:glycosyltransferase involved in cell wall biosynthesis
LSKKSLYITFDGLTDPLGQSQILPYLIGIANNGYGITILSCEKKERLENGKKAVLDLIINTSISWKYIIYDEEGGALSRFLYLKKLSVLAKNLHKKNQFNLVHCRSYLSSLIGLNFKLKYKIPFIFDMRGFWADERIDGGIWKKSKLLHRIFYNYFKKKEKQFLINSNAIVSLTQNGVKELIKTNPKINIIQKTTVIPCCCNTELFNKDKIQEKINLNGISEGDFVLVYTGSIGTWYYTKEMIDCVLIWKDFIPKLKLLIVTKDSDSLNTILKNYSSNISDTIITVSASYREIPNYLSIAQAAIFFIKPSYSKIASSPTKMAECWAMNLPIITNSGIGDNDIFFKNNLGGVLINNFSKEEYEEAYKKFVELMQQKNDYRNIALTNFDTKDAITKYTYIYDNLTN